MILFPWNKVKGSRFPVHLNAVVLLVVDSVIFVFVTGFVVRMMMQVVISVLLLLQQYVMVFVLRLHMVMVVMIR